MNHRKRGPLHRADRRTRLKPQLLDPNPITGNVERTCWFLERRGCQIAMLTWRLQQQAATRPTASALSPRAQFRPETASARKFQGKIQKREVLVSCDHWVCCQISFLCCRRHSVASIQTRTRGYTTCYATLPQHGRTCLRSCLGFSKGNHGLSLCSRLTSAVMVGDKLGSLRRLCYGVLILPTVGSV